MKWVVGTLWMLRALTELAYGNTAAYAKGGTSLGKILGFWWGVAP